MPFRDNPTHLRDIIEGIEYIEAFVGDMSLDAYRADPLRKSAVERQLQIITEAAKRLGNDAYVLCPDEDWKGFCRMGDVLRHGYQKIDDEIIWNTVKDELPKMREAALKALNSPHSSQNRA
ncbi:MAG: HepT-like ribonuclease domain-containing protein [Silvibacterium sp.]